MCKHVLHVIMVEEPNKTHGKFVLHAHREEGLITA